jgi:hypothetical protein
MIRSHNRCRCPRPCRHRRPRHGPVDRVDHRHGVDHHYPPPDDRQEHRPEVRYRRPALLGFRFCGRKPSRGPDGRWRYRRTGVRRHAPRPPQFHISGEGGQSVSVTIPATFTMINGVRQPDGDHQQQPVRLGRRPNPQQRAGLGGFAGLQCRWQRAGRLDHQYRRLLRDLHSLRPAYN